MQKKGSKRCVRGARSGLGESGESLRTLACILYGIQGDLESIVIWRKSLYSCIRGVEV